ncbi:hypothetical protein [Streptomyces sp. NPDC058441]|uniref:hypothetical protein n=1 Tax=Streptomyces sp. NPDC058441 TaxID=3346502 RepID=UPI00364F020A
MADVLLYATNTIPKCRITGTWDMYWSVSYVPLREALDEMTATVAKWGATAVVALKIQPIPLVSGGQVGVGTKVGYLVYGTPVTYEGT